MSVSKTSLAGHQVRWGFVHIAQCREFVTNDSNHWILDSLTVSLYLFLYSETASVSLGVDLEAAGHPALTISTPH